MSSLRSTLSYFLRYKYRLLLGIIFVLLSSFFAILAPQFTGYVIDLSVRKQQEINVSSYNSIVQWLISYFSTWDMRYVIVYCSLSILVFALVRGVFMYAMRQTLVVMSRWIEYDQKNILFQKYLNLDMSFYQQHAIGDMMSRMAEDIGRVRMLMGPAVMYIFNIIAMAGFSIYYMWQKHSLLTCYVLIPLPVLAFIIYRVSTITHARSLKVQQSLASSTSFARNAFAGVRVLQSFDQEERTLKQFEHKTANYLSSSLSLAWIQSLFMPSISLVVSLSVVATVLVGGIYFIEGSVTMGTLTEFVIYLNMLVFPITALGWVANLIQRALASQRRIDEFMHTPSCLVDGSLSSPIAGDVRFENIFFRYPDKDSHALNGLSFHIQPGEKIGIVGMIGSGKSTIAQLLFRFYDPQQGRILFDHHSATTYVLRDLRSQMAYVPQDVFLFSGTIIENLRFGNPSLETEEAHSLLRAVDLLQDIDQFPQGMDTLIGEKGVTLSGGQKQRLSIARALATKANIIVLDDCFSSIDEKTEAAILEHILQRCEGKTMIIISHRYNIMPRMDKILVLKDGVLAEQGTHAILLANKAHYFDLCESFE